MYRKIILFPCVLMFAAGNALAADVQVLGLQLPGDQADVNLASNSNNDECGQYRIDAVTLTVVPGIGTAAAGTVTVLDPSKQQIALKTVAAKEQSSVKVTVLDKDNAAPESLDVVLLKVKDGTTETEVLARAETNVKGEAAFGPTVPAGNYQIGLECGTPVAGYAAPLGAAGVIGATALAISLTGGNSSSSESLGRTVTTPATNPVSAPSFVPQQSGSSAPQHSGSSFSGNHGTTHVAPGGTVTPHHVGAPGGTITPQNVTPNGSPQGTASL